MIELLSPLPRTIIENRTPYFEMQLSSDLSAGDYHVKFKISLSPDISDNYIELFSADDATNWEYYDGSAWVGFPSGGVNPGTKVRVIPQKEKPLHFAS
ncbi:MAG: hypothetical protein K9L56_15520, partial [Clostridiales bacterium]|nr:hypothetical protein [Clostridiales bacterium]